MFRIQGLQLHEVLVIQNRMHVGLELNQRLLENATPKICDQKRFAVTIEYVSSDCVGVNARNVFAASPSSNSVFSTVAP